MRLLSLVNFHRGSKGSGSIRLRATWLKTKIWIGSIPLRIAIVVGIVFMRRVTIRRTQRFVFLPNIPSMMA